MLHTDLHFANQISYNASLRNFRHVSTYVWRFSCPFCGDSKKNKTKARGFLLRGDSGLYYKCQNCGKTCSFGNFLKEQVPTLFREWLLESFKNQKEYEKLFEKQEKKEEYKHKLRLEKLPYATALSDLEDDHFAIKYVSKRRIPEEAYDKLYYIENFKEFADKLKPRCIQNLKNDHPRLVIPFFDENGKVFAFQGRAFGNEKPKYMTIKLDESTEKLFGLERLNDKEEIYVTEGPIDSLFVNNCIAVAGGALNAAEFLIKKLGISKNKITLVPDREPRNKDIVRLIEKYAENGYNVSLLPDNVEGKDINDLILLGYSRNEIMRLIKDNTFNGIRLRIEIVKWKKI